MSRLENALGNNLKLLKLLRDEINLKAHLLKQDARSRLDELDARFGELKVHVERAEMAGAAARREAEAAAERLVQSLREGYTRIRDALKG